MTVSLRPLRPADAPWLDTWLPAAAEALGGTPPATAGLMRGLGAKEITGRVVVRDGEDAGLLVYRTAAPTGHDAIIELVATPPGHARRGSGMRAAAMLEDRLRASGTRRMYAPAPAAHGIAVYFWIRLGYRPLLRADWPCDIAGVGWLVREVR